MVYLPQMNSFIVKSNFWGTFKVGDNVNFNLAVLTLLYEVYNDPNYEGSKELLVKPIVITLIALIEAAIYDFINRCHNNTREGVIGITDDDLTCLRTSKVKDRFDYAISILRRLDILKSKSKIIYKELDKLREIRNRVHIQNSKNDIPHDERGLFRSNIKKTSEICAEIVYKTLAKYYPRSKDLHYVYDLRFPWKEYIPNIYI